MSERVREIRIHGIGDHQPLSALDPPDFSEEFDGKVTVDGPPTVPTTHGLRLVNWSRANRKLTGGLVWYLALPFTLVNVAGYMEPPYPQPNGDLAPDLDDDTDPANPDADRRERSARGNHASLLRLIVFSIGLSLTISMAAWASVTLETLWRWLENDTENWLTNLILYASPSGILIVVLLYRSTRGKKGKNGSTTLFSTISILTLVALALAMCSRPNERKYPGTDYKVDFMRDLVACTAAITLIGALILSSLSVVSRWRKKSEFYSKEGASGAGAALLCLIALSILHTGGSILRQSSSLIAEFFIHPQTDPVQGTLMLLSSGQSNAAQSVSLTLPRKIDLLPLFLFEAIAVFVATLVGLYFVSNRGAVKRHEVRVRRGPHYRIKDEKMRCVTPVTRWHDLVSDLGTIIPLTSLITTVATTMIWILTAAAFRDISLESLDQWALGLKIVSALVIILVVLRKPAFIGNFLGPVFGKAGDIAGFWSPDTQPLAGTSYRYLVITAIDKTITEATGAEPPIVLVGHSQGSVIAAWFIAVREYCCDDLWYTKDSHSDRKLADMWWRERNSVESPASDPARENPLLLITCGSPIDTLYVTFFPRFFNEGFLQRVKRESYQNSWYNYWRQTDPIASPITCTEDFNITEVCGSKILGHSSYFKSPAITEKIQSVIASRT